MALERAIKLAGGPAAVATFINANFEEKASAQAVSQWKRCPAKRAIQLERATAGAVSRSDLRPDLYPAREAA